MKIYPMHEEFVPMGSGLPRSDYTETGKPHLTDIIKALEEHMGWAPKAKWPEKWLTMEVGFWWEDMLGKVYGERSAAIRPDEVERDGIVGSPDGVGPDPGLTDADGKIIIPPDPNILVLEEYKATWRSVKTTPDKVWKYMTQAMSYCAMMELDVVVFRIAYLFGDWKGTGPQYKPYRIEFEQDEIDDNWAMIVDFAKEKGFLK